MATTDRERRICLLLNSRSGNGWATTMRHEIMRELSPLDVDVHEVTVGTEVRQIVRDAVRAGANEVVAVGGDGTVSAVADALVGTGASLGIIPMGTSNMLARELKVPLSTTLAARTVRQRPASVRIDALCDGRRHFFYQMVIGYAAEVASITRDWEKRSLGPTAYVLAGLRQLPRHHPLRIVGKVDGMDIDVEVHEVKVASAGILFMESLLHRPDVRPDDGRVEVILIPTNNGSVWTDVSYGGRWDWGRLYLCARSEIVLDTDPPAVIKGDGDIVGRTPMRLRVVPGAVDVIVPHALRRGGGEQYAHPHRAGPGGHGELRGGDRDSWGAGHHQLSRLPGRSTLSGSHALRNPPLLGWAPATPLLAPTDGSHTGIKKEVTDRA